MAYRLLTSRVLYQNSKYAPVAVIRLELDIPDEGIPGFSPSLMNAALAEICKRGAGGEIFLSDSGTSLENFCDLVLRLQRYAGHEVVYSRVDTHYSGRESHVFIEYEDHATALYAAELALDLVNTVLDNLDGLATNTISALQQQLNEYTSFALERLLDPNTRLLKGAARQQDIPAMSLDPPWGMPTWPGAAEHNGIIQYYWGINQRRCRGTLALGSLSSQQIQQCSDRAQLLARLKNANLPIAGQDLEFINRNQIKRALRSARRIGYPVTIRPRYAALPQYGLLDNGVFGPAENDEQVTLIARFLREQAGTDTWVESFVSGAHYRFLILGKEVVSVIRFIPPTVVGDGVQTVAGLAQAKAETAIDAESHRVWHLLAKGDDALLCRLQSKGKIRSSIPAPGEVIKLRGVGTYYNGGTGKEVLEEVPAHFSAVALQAAIVFGLERMAGIDLIIEDLQGTAEMPNCAVMGVDPVPDLVSHSKLSETNNERIPAKYFSQLFPQGKSSRIPTVSVTGTNGKTTTSRMIARILKESGLKVGLACSDGVYLDDELLMCRDEAGVLGAHDVLSSMEMEAAVLETARGGMANMGIAFKHIDVGACLNVADDHLGVEGIETIDQMAVHKRQVIERSTDAVVLNAEDSRCVTMREHTPAKEVILFAYNPDHPMIKIHVENGGRAVVVDVVNKRPTIIIKTSRTVEPVMAVEDIPATNSGTVLHNVYNALAAVGIANGLGISVEHIVSGLTKFVMGVNTTPGRLNEISGFPFEVLIDAAHNPHGIRALLQYVNQREVAGKKIIVFGIRNTFSDESIRECSALVAGNFGLYILRNYRVSYPCGPAEVRVLEILKMELIRHGVQESEIILEQGVPGALDRGIECSGTGDLLVVQVPASGPEKWEIINRIMESEYRVGAD